MLNPAIATQAPALTSSQDAALSKLRDLDAALNGVFLERRDEIRSLIVATLAGEHALLLGSPGTGKSALTKAFSEAFGGRYFERLVSKFTVPEELFGPFSLAGLENDLYERKVDGYLPTAEVAFLDEVFKANSAVLNSLLTILNEREFDNGTNRIACPLKVCIGASNELPNNDEGDSLDALYDRFTMRRWVQPLKSRDSRRKLLAMKGAPKIAVRIDNATLKVARDAVRSVVMSDDATEALLDLQEALASECGIEMSDRRLRKCDKILRAYAALQGRVVVMPEDLEVLADSLWNKPDERAPVMGQIMKVSNPAKAEAAMVYDAAVEALQSVDLKAVTLTNIRPVSGLLHKLREMESTVRGLSTHPSVAAIADDIGLMEREVATAVSKAMAR